MRMMGMDQSQRKVNHTRRNARAPAEFKCNELTLIFCFDGCASNNNMHVHSTLRQCSLPPSVALFAKILGNLQMFPVPTTEPIIVRRTPMEDVK
jgi:hypothetical protein